VNVGVDEAFGEGQLKADRNQCLIRQTLGLTYLAALKAKIENHHIKLVRVPYPSNLRVLLVTCDEILYEHSSNSTDLQDLDPTFLECRRIEYLAINVSQILKT
jgi:hypothetical protein